MEGNGIAFKTLSYFQCPIKAKYFQCPIKKYFQCPFAKQNIFSVPLEQNWNVRMEY